MVRDPEVLAAIRLSLSRRGPQVTPLGEEDADSDEEIVGVARLAHQILGAILEAAVRVGGARLAGGLAGGLAIGVLRRTRARRAPRAVGVVHEPGYSVAPFDEWSEQVVFAGRARVLGVAAVVDLGRGVDLREHRAVVCGRDRVDGRGRQPHGGTDRRGVRPVSDVGHA